MKTEDIINLDCTKQESKKILNRFLWKVKPCAKLLEKNNYTKTEQAPIELLEQVLHGMCKHYKYKLQQIWSYEEELEFKFYSMGVIKVTKTNEWIGTVSGKTLWEVVAKGIIKIYGDIKENRKQ